MIGAAPESQNDTEYNSKKSLFNFYELRLELSLCFYGKEKIGAFRR